MTDPAELSPPPPLADLAARGPVALFVDFDGTLIDIAPTPQGIAVPETLAKDIARLSDRLGGRLAIVSGRSIDDLERHLGPMAVACAGSHGASRRLADGTMLGAEADEFPLVVADEVAAFAAANGVDYERKIHGAALHSRLMPSMEVRCAIFLDELAERHSLDVKRGKMVAELVRPGADKGSAVRAFAAVAPFAGAQSVFIGDDVTDEDGFAACEAIGGFGIAVGSRDTANARYALADPDAVYQWLGL
ncbi:trehalose-phosphatase [Tsuneonella amylolytica]|uniref:trehalose-phosphatase n=1 Tax=Tsuneonella amylolytica TaxID=2338327 RepID=UPI0013C40936|nr:trehalose-phosphatase [Tsuneonella amylolytica]